MTMKLWQSHADRKSKAKSEVSIKAKRGLVIAGILVAAAFAVWGISRIWQAKNSSDITVTAAVLSTDEAGQTTRSMIRPKAAA